MAKNPPTHLVQTRFVAAGAAERATARAIGEREPDVIHFRGVKQLACGPERRSEIRLCVTKRGGVAVKAYG